MAKVAAHQLPELLIPCQQEVLTVCMCQPLPGMNAAIDPHGGLRNAPRGRHPHLQEEQVLPLGRLANPDVLRLKLANEQ